MIFSLSFLMVTTLLGAAITYDISIRPKTYLSLDQDLEPQYVSNQVGIQISAGLSAYIIDDFLFRTELSYSHIPSTEMYGFYEIRGFDSLSLGLGTGVTFCDYFGVYSILYAHYSTYNDTSVRFAHLELSAIPYFLLIESESLDILLDLPITYDIRRDLDHNISIGVGIRLSFPSGGVDP